MGTRGLIGYIIAAQRYASYNHFDSYPSGLGRDIAEFIINLDPAEYELMAERVRNITWVDEDSLPSADLQHRYELAGYADIFVGNRSLDNWYCLLRKVQGAKQLAEIKYGLLEHLVNAVNFLDDEVFCEWAYFIDFENHKIEVWASCEMVRELSFEYIAAVGAKDSMRGIEGEDESL